MSLRKRVDGRTEQDRGRGKLDQTLYNDVTRRLRWIAANTDATAPSMSAGLVVERSSHLPFTPGRGTA